MVSRKLAVREALSPGFAAAAGATSCVDVAVVDAPAAAVPRVKTFPTAEDAGADVFAERPPPENAADFTVAPAATTAFLDCFELHLSRFNGERFRVGSNILHWLSAPYARP